MQTSSSRESLASKGDLTPESRLARRTADFVRPEQQVRGIRLGMPNLIARNDYRIVRDGVGLAASPARSDGLGSRTRVRTSGKTTRTEARGQHDSRSFAAPHDHRAAGARSRAATIGRGAGVHRKTTSA